MIQKRRGRGEDEVDEAEEIEIIDDLAVVDDEMITKERITALAGGDPRRLAILNAWTYDGFNDSQTASLLAQRYGGNTESHRKYVARFRTACRAALA
ncbi:hypothetical protein [Paenibacillus cisolokensis]|uniref:hypothetical protein n=1 Tax=Paenibacillus cisolokensis TaxID=1658519 RepID=UPI001BD1B1CB|nr:hypothetical protein [Paenibacillus cisolokensis]